uniref:Uncharacterized protein n=1 Tax=Arundo donax TaxID=35708 RepID=A0A0A9D6Q7_ARUDO
MNDGQGDVPGSYFVGRPTNHAEAPEPEKKEEPQAAGEEKPATTQTPGDYFIGRPEGHQKQQNTNPGGSNFLAKCCPCLAGGGAAD